MLFEFRCKKCEKVTEAIVKSNTEEIECPECGSVAKKIISAPHFHIRGFNAANGYSHKKKVKPKGGST
jgi:putative FmdB family regulatory protein